jgi:membrane-associated phospholipid phosphatase
MFGETLPFMQYIQRFCRHQLRVCVRISRVALISSLPLVSFAQQVDPQSQAQPQLQSQPQPQLQSQPQLQTQPQVQAQPQLQTQPCIVSSPAHCFAQVGKDQKGILTSPFRVQKKDLLWITPLAAATGAAFAFDHTAMEHISTDPSQVSAFQTASNITGIYLPIAAAGTALLGGTLRHDEHLRETGTLAMTAMIDTQLLTTFMKFGVQRARPGATGPTPNAGAFWVNGKISSGSDSFPSGHTANAFAMAHVIADEYPGWKVKLAVYGLAAATGFERVAGREHFPSDALVGGAVGYLVGGYVFNHHSTRAKTHVAFAPYIGHGGAGISLQLSRSANP